jgi:hypothetical protein
MALGRDGDQILLHGSVVSRLMTRLADLRPSTRKELNATTLLALPLQTFSIKSRNGPPGDAKGDLDTPIWAGVIPLSLVAGNPEPAPDIPGDIPLPDYLQLLCSTR